jgi:hypothetical protein
MKDQYRRQAGWGWHLRDLGRETSLNALKILMSNPADIHYTICKPKSGFWRNFLLLLRQGINTGKQSKPASLN